MPWTLAGRRLADGALVSGVLLYVIQDQAPGNSPQGIQTPANSQARRPHARQARRDPRHDLRQSPARLFWKAHFVDGYA